jgi:hypothetical protein
LLLKHERHTLVTNASDRVPPAAMYLLTRTGCFVGLALLAFAMQAASLPVQRPLEEFIRLKLQAFSMPSTPGPVGLVIVARVNGGPPLRLLLDSGAQFLFLDKKGAARSGCRGGEPLDLVGAGSANPVAATKVKASTVDVGGLTLRQVDIGITDKRLFDNADGVFPLALFANFLIRLDLPAKNLDLLPYPDGKDFGSPVVFSHGLLFVKALLNGTEEGLFLLDTGASYNAISTRLARRIKSTNALSQPISVQSGTARIDAPFVPEALRFRIGTQDLRADPVVTVDLSAASHHHNFEISGLIGYPALRSSVLTINYRDGLAQIYRK